MKNYLVILFASLSFFSCSDDMQDYDHSKIFIQIENGLKSPIWIEWSAERPLEQLNPNETRKVEENNWFNYTSSLSSAYQLKFMFADSSVKMDRKCEFFQSEPAYYSVCTMDSISVFLRACFQVSTYENDTTYIYKISVADSLEAN